MSADDMLDQDHWARTSCSWCKGWGFVFPPSDMHPHQSPACPFCDGTGYVGARPLNPTT